MIKIQSVYQSMPAKYANEKQNSKRQELDKVYSNGQGPDY